MKISIIAAMSKELSLLLPLLEGHKTETVDGTTHHTGRIGHHEVVAVQSGIGKVNAALATHTLIERYAPSLVINTGVAGGVGKTKVLDIVVPSRVAYHDVWCGPGTVWGEAAGCPREFECSFGGESSLTLRMDGLLASGDIFISRREEVEHILNVYPDAIAVDMESAAIAQACYLKGVYFACIRVVSDTPGSDDNISQYETFWEDAPQATFGVVTEILSGIES